LNDLWQTLTISISQLEMLNSWVPTWYCFIYIRCVCIPLVPLFTIYEVNYWIMVTISMLSIIALKIVVYIMNKLIYYRILVSKVIANMHQSRVSLMELDTRCYPFLIISLVPLLFSVEWPYIYFLCYTHCVLQSVMITWKFFWNYALNMKHLLPTRHFLNVNSENSIITLPGRVDINKNTLGGISDGIHNKSCSDPINTRY